MRRQVLVEDRSEALALLRALVLDLPPVISSLLKQQTKEFLKRIDGVKNG